MNIDVNKGDAIVVIRGKYQGRLGYFESPFPYPEGGAGFIVKLVNNDPKLSAPYEKVNVNIDDFIPVSGIKPENTPVIPEEEELKTIGARYAMNQRVVISHPGPYRGYAGYIRHIIPVCGGLLYDYEVEPANQMEEPRISMTIPEEGIVPLDYRCTMINGFDIGRYITTEFMVNVAQETYEKGVKEFVDRIMENRSIGGVGIVDWILGQACEKYIDQMSPDIQKEFIARIKSYIATEKIGGKEKYDDSLEDMINQCVVRAAEKYMTDHMDEYHPLIKAKVQEAAERITAENFLSFVSRSINFKEILSQALKSSEEK